MPKRKKSFRFIDLFAGIGGFHIAMHENGGDCVFASEIDKFARQTYEHNFKSISPQMFENGNFNKDITDEELNYSKIPEFDILCAGFPCQPFSHAGLKKGFDDTRGTLFFNIKEIVKAKIEAHKKNSKVTIPKVLLLENVKGFKNHDKGNTFRVIKKTLNDLGYEVAAEVLNSKHFGVPQNRERIFIVAWYRDSVKKSEFKFPYGIDKDGMVIYDKSKRDDDAKPISVGDILLKNSELEKLEKKSNKTYTISEKLWDGHQRRRTEHAEKGNGFGYSSFNSKSAYTSTISARYYKDGSEILIEQNNIPGRPDRPRKLHPTEAARLQGFPIDNWYEIPVSDNQAYKQFGNSVSVPVVKTVASEIIKQLLN
ncbi:DNA cytosine methyltransferase [Flavobacterium lindanitolerans]|uniref:Cytosine-specific methyltransferase n=1 Tax=Flavobacterium lindanitolerans TaxID=428988 RepID=A0A497UH60_9FLAO|nr:DNA (cytosine-5-)-methyltransferase [Flavobacterium lindanitolerans]PKW20520.1 DNA (cytosine-5)-methyltransferase 1 [Flavobacterium lindanitolerans]RLJ23963.1 DNA (cytosine-5)-methyltransferase 1 [Flavobacterium lindanitolerans]